MFLAVGIFSVGFCEVHYQNTLSKIVIDEEMNNNFNVNLVFEEQFNGNAFLQKRHNGSYYIYIPDSYANRNGIKVLYRDINNKHNIKINIEEAPFITENNESSYIKVDVNIIGNYTIQLYSKTIDQYAEEPVSFQYDKYNLICGIILLLAVILLGYILIKASKNNRPKKKYVPLYSSNTLPSEETEEEETYIEDRENREFREDKSSVVSKPIEMTMPVVKDIPLPDNHVLPKVNIKKSMKPSEGESFSCFDIPFAGELENKMSSEEIKNAMKQTSQIQKEKSAKAKLTNPITMAKKEAEKLDMPAAEDVFADVIKKASESKKNEPELLSELRITPRKGFYLTTIEDTFALFGFVDSNVYLLKKFKDLSQINLQARFYDRQKNGDMYIVKLDSYKAMIEISDTGMKELAVL